MLATVTARFLRIDAAGPSNLGKSVINDAPMQRTHYALGVFVCSLALGLLDVMHATARMPDTLTPTLLLGSWLVSSAAVLTLAAPLLCARFWLLGVLPARLAFVVGALDGLAFGYVGLVREEIASVEMSTRVQLTAALMICGALAVLVARRFARWVPALCIVCGALALGYAETLPAREKQDLRLATDVLGLAGIAYGCAAWLARFARLASSPGVVTAALVLFVAVGHVTLAHTESVRALIYEYAPHAQAFLAPVRKYELEPSSDGPKYGGHWCPKGEAPRTRKSKPTRSTGVAAGADVLMLSFDALRFDRIDSIPHVWKTVGEHVRFTRAVVPAPRTVDSISAMLRGVPARYVPFVSASFGAKVARRAPPTIAKVLTKRGYRAVHVPTHRYFDTDKGVNRGFELAPTHNFADTRLRSHGAYNIVRAEDALGKALDIAKTTQQPLLLWVHLMEGHEPYRWDGGFGPESPEGQLHAYRDLDVKAAAFIREFRKARGDKDPVIAIFGDHGEEFGEHGGKFHSSSVYAELSRAVLAVHAPGMKGHVVRAPVSHASLPATLLDLLGQKPAKSFRAPSLLPCIDSARACPKVAVTQMAVYGRSIGYTVDRYRLLVDPVRKLERLYDSETDPFEKHDISESQPEVLEQVRALALSFDREHCFER